MKTLHKRCAGLDVHKAEVVACVRLISKRKVEREVRRFPTTTQGLLALAEWLESAGCTHVAMEATGVYWKPGWHILEGRFALILANAAHVRNVGDVNDATWLADLLAHGDARIEAALSPFHDIVERLEEVPGLAATSTETVIAEIGTDMSLFPTAGHLLSWAGFAPRLDESAGKHRSTRIRKGAPWLKPVLVQAAWGAARKKNSYFQAQFLRLKARHGAKKAAIAVAASILTTVYHMLRDGTCYQDLGPEYFTRRNPAQAAARLANRIRNLGYHVEIRAAA